MKRIRNSMILAAVVVFGLIAFSATSHAGWGRGGGYGGGMGDGSFPRQGFGGPGPGGALTDEEIAVIQKERNAFFESTRDTRGLLEQKRLELRAEMAKKSPDAKKAAELQKEISGLRNALDQKRLEHQLRMRQEHPELYGKGFGAGAGRGMGPRHGMGPGGYGRGPGMGPYWQ